MDRGINLLFQGNRAGFAGQRADQGDRRFNANPNNRLNLGGANWNNAPNQMGFPNQAVQGQAGSMLNALQQQNLINALIAQNQQQSNIGQGHPNRFQNNRYPPGNNNHSNRHNNNRDRRGGLARPGDKRKNHNPPQGGFNNNKQGKKAFNNKNKTSNNNTQKNTPKSTPKKELKIEEIDIPDDQVVIPDLLMETVEKLRMRTDVKRNVVDEDVEKLLVFSFTGKSYQCKTCGVNVVKDHAFSEHLMSKNHVMKVIDARTAKKYQSVRDLLDVDLSGDDWFENSQGARKALMQQAKVLMKMELNLKAKKEATYNKTPSNFFNFNMELRKSVVKKDEEVIITSLVESNVAVKDFTGEKFFGCEFVRAVTGFHCRLCSINIREAKGAIPHIESKLHKTNYNSYTRKNPEYEKTQKEQNQDLFEIMTQHDGKSVVLAESANVEGSQFLSQLDDKLVRIPSVMKPETKKDKENEKTKEGEEAEKEGDNIIEGDKADTNVENLVEVDEEKTDTTEEPVKEEVEAEGSEENMEDDQEKSNDEIVNDENEVVEDDDNEVVEDNEDVADESTAAETEGKTDVVDTPPKRGRGRSKAK